MRAVQAFIALVCWGGSTIDRGRNRHLLQLSGNYQSALSAIDNHLATSGKFLLPFSIIWFPACIVVSIFYGGLFSGVMVTLGLFIALGFKGAVPAVDEVMVLTRHLDSDQPVSLEKSALN